ncbi:cell division ATP-binding protein FtsE [Candidatus Nomurabacteria bacterium]|nr:cell division ATP-binding protein FtsE [Candidatus Nomurabacteria bacterium]
MIYFDNVSKTYGDDTPALKGVNLKIDANEFLSIVGHSGAGKTTLLKLLLAEEHPSEGTIFFQSDNIHDLKGNEISQLRRKIGSIFQDFRLIPNKTVFENVAFAMEAAGRSEGEIEADVPHAVNLVDLGHKMWSFPRELSGGEQQRVAIARAIVNQPDVIIADEPTGNLDPINTYEVVQILKKINDLGTTVILTTHNKGVIDSVGRRVITLEDGKIVRDDPTGKYVI